MDVPNRPGQRLSSSWRSCHIPFRRIRVHHGTSCGARSREECDHGSRGSLQACGVGLRSPGADAGFPSPARES